MDKEAVQQGHCAGVRSEPRSWLGSAHWATTLETRLLGLLGSRHGNSLLALVPCHDIHTYGMARRIDVAFVDANGRVLAAWRSVGAGQRLKVRGAAFAVEREARDDAPWPTAEDRLIVGFEEVRDEDMPDMRSESL